MDSISPHIRRFGWPDRSLRGLGPKTAGRLLAHGSDVAVVIDGRGVVSDVAFGADEIAQGGYESWVGQPWIDTVTSESRPKIEALLRDAAREDALRWREVNHPGGDDAPDLPVRYLAAQAGTHGRIIAVGRELRGAARMQQQLIEAQQSVERDFERLRHAETRYRVLFQVGAEPVLIINAHDLRVSDANPAALRLIGDTAGGLIGRPILSIFDAADAPVVRALLDEARTARQANDAAARLADEGGRCVISASLFRQERAAYYLMRMADDRTGPRSGEPRRSAFVETLEALPDGLVVARSDLRIVTANAAFLEMAQLATLEQARGEALDQFLGRTGVDLGVLVSKLGEHNSVRHFSTLVRGQFGSQEEVELSAVVAMDQGEPYYGFALRPLALRPSATDRSSATGEGRALPRSVEQLTELVGRVSLKEIVRETTDLIECLCIEAALELTGDNRASAAEILGLSRQGLYAKLHRYGLGPAASNDDNN